ncbi:MAG TPA: hypothetical protein VI894_01125 [Candidatus Nanoarchaeia archaeon]|nr:hypothetical protein [Candidatus Nanoarchaeia archaeon]
MGLLEKARQMREKLEKIEKKEQEVQRASAIPTEEKIEAGKPEQKKAGAEAEKKEEKAVKAEVKKERDEVKVEEKNEEKREERKEEKTAEQPKLTAGKIETDIDKVQEYISKKGSAKIDEIALNFKIPKEKAEQWLSMLADSHLIHLVYPAVGNPTAYSNEMFEKSRKEKEKEKWKAKKK